MTNRHFGDFRDFSKNHFSKVCTWLYSFRAPRTWGHDARGLSKSTSCPSDFTMVAAWRACPK